MSRPRLTDFATAAVIGLPLIYALPFRKSVNDYGVYVAVGQRMIETGGLADASFLNHTVMGEPYLNATWLSALIFGAWDLAGGAALTVLAHALCVGLAFWLPFAHARAGRGGSGDAGRSGRAALAVLICAPLMLGNLGLRPQTLTLWIFPLLHWIGARYIQRRWAPLAVAGLTAIWANAHGAFPLVIPLMGTFFVEALIHRDRAAIRATGLALAAGTAATFATPYGWGSWVYIADNVGISMVIGSEEFEPVAFTSWRFARMVLVGGVAGWLLARRPRPRWADVFAALGLGALALSSQRAAIWWGMALIPILAARLPARALELSTLSRRVLTGVFGFLTVAALARFPRETEAEYFNAPVIFEAADAIEARFPDGARLFASAEWGALFPWRLGPAWPTFLDTRAWIFSEALWAEYTMIARAEGGWEAALRRRGVDVVAVDLPRFHRLTDALAADPGWAPLLSTPEGAVYARREGGH